MTAAGVAPVRRRGRRVLWALTVALLLGLAALAFVPLPYVIMGPGPVTNTLGNTAKGTSLITVEASRDHPSQGVLNFTTVSVRGGPGSTVTVYDLAAAKLTGHSEIVPEEAVFPKGATSDDVKAENAAEMTGSQQDAIAVAERAAGLTVTETVAVGQVAPGSPATGLLKPGDVLTRVGGRAVTSSTMLREAIQSVPAGGKAAVVVKRAGTTRAVEVPVKVHDGRKVIGVILKTAFTFPVKVAIDAGDVGGPSAGLMFSLGVYDRLTPGELTGGKRIAGTGTMSPEGQVGPIGGIQQKVAGARAAGSEWFLVPADNCRELEGAVPDDIHAVRVTTFAEALSDVRAIAAGKAGSLPTCG